MRWDATTTAFLQGFLPTHDLHPQRGLAPQMDHPSSSPSKPPRRRPRSLAGSDQRHQPQLHAPSAPSAPGNNSSNNPHTNYLHGLNPNQTPPKPSPPRRTPTSQTSSPTKPSRTRPNLGGASSGNTGGGGGGGSSSTGTAKGGSQSALSSSSKFPLSRLLSSSSSSRHNGTALPERALLYASSPEPDDDPLLEPGAYTSLPTEAYRDRERERGREINHERYQRLGRRGEGGGGGGNRLRIPDMSSDKRRERERGHGHGHGHVLRTASSHSTRNRNNSGGSSIIAPPPRAAIHAGSSSSSPGPPAEESASHDANASPSAKDGNAASGSTPTVASLKDMIREKDDRILHLEKELSIMEQEFTRELDKLSQNESETATFWQNKHSALNQQYLRTDTELRLLRAEVEVRQGEREELREGWDMLRRELRERDEEIKGLRGQVRGLKEWVSTSTRSDGEARTSDEVFGDGMTRLGNGLQNWVIVNFRRAKMDLGKASEAALEELGGLVPMYADLASTAKVHLLQSIVSRVLVEMVFSAYFFGLSKEQTSQFRQMEALLSSFSDSAEPVNQWRSATLTILRRDTSQTLQPATEAATDAVIQRVNRVLESVTNAEATESRDQALRVLVNNSVELARLLAVQKAVFEVWMPDILPHQRTVFDAVTMEDIGGEDDDGLVAREISCVAFPAVIKRGDESGGHLQYRNVVAKARVLVVCRPE